MFHDVDNFKTYVGILTNVNTNISLDILTSFVRKVIEKNGYNSDQCISGGKKKKKTACRHGITNTKWMFVSVGNRSASPVFGKIVNMLLACNKLFFLILVFRAPLVL